MTPPDADEPPDADDETTTPAWPTPRRRSSPVPAPGTGPEPAPEGPIRTPPRRRGVTIAAVVGMAVLLVAAALIASRGDGDGQEVYLEPTSTARDPFTVAVGVDGSISATDRRQPGVASVRGDTADLYGGRRGTAQCDRTKLVDLLRADPQKATAWAGVLDLEPASIPSYVKDLTPALLREDTRVTIHGYRGGDAVTSQAVLQAGTAVLVDERGLPVTKCVSGNPLSRPESARATYVGDRWEGFSEEALTSVVPSEVALDSLELVDDETGDRFTRPTGTDGPDDADAPAAAPTDPTTTTTSPSPTTDGAATTPSTTAVLAERLSGTYSFSGEVLPGSDAGCSADSGTLDVVVDGDDDDRTVAITYGSLNWSGPLTDDLGFALTSSFPPVGSASVTGRFGLDGGGASFAATLAISTDLTCQQELAGSRQG